MSLLLSHKNSWFNLWFSLLPILLLGRRIAILARWRKAEKAHREADIVFYFMSNHRNNSEHQAAQTRFSSASRSRTSSHDKLHTNRETGKKHQASEEVWLRGHLRVGRWRRSYVRGNVWTYSIWTLPAVATLVTDMPLRITVILQQSVVHAPHLPGGSYRGIWFMQNLFCCAPCFWPVSLNKLYSRSQLFSSRILKG